MKSEDGVTKICSKCRERKLLKDFHAQKQSSDGLYPQCACCKNAAGRELARKRKEEREKANPFDPFNKKCPKCGERKPLDQFYTAQHTRTGRNSHCKICIKIRSKQRYRDEVDFREAAKRSRKAYYYNNPESCAASSKNWLVKNAERARASRKVRWNKKVSTVYGKLETRVLGLIRSSVARRVGPRETPTEWRSILGYDFAALKAHLESQFTQDMTWDKLMDGKIEIDHIVPRSSFYYETVEDQDFKDCWALSNLQPLWVKDNRSKADKMPDGSRGRCHGDRKIALLNEEYSVAGWEVSRTYTDDIFG